VCLVNFSALIFNPVMSFFNAQIPQPLNYCIHSIQIIFGISLLSKRSEFPEFVKKNTFFEAMSYSSSYGIPNAKCVKTFACASTVLEPVV